MKPSLLGLAEDLRRQPSLELFWEQINRSLAAYGVNGCMYAAMTTRKGVDPKKPTQAMLFKSSYNKIFFDTFDASKLLDDDASVEHCFGAVDAFFWHDDRLMPYLTKEQLKRVMIERDVGFHVGVTIPLARAKGRLGGGIGLNIPSVPLSDFSKFWKEHSQDILTICNFLDVGMEELHMGEFVGLSAREKECLTWLAAGLRMGQIADRLGIGESSVEKYITSARVKLKAQTRDQAIATAIVFGLIEL